MLHIGCPKLKAISSRKKTSAIGAQATRRQQHCCSRVNTKINHISNRSRRKQRCAFHKRISEERVSKETLHHSDWQNTVNIVKAIRPNKRAKRTSKLRNREDFSYRLISRTGSPQELLGGSSIDRGRSKGQLPHLATSTSPGLIGAL